MVLEDKSESAVTKCQLKYSIQDSKCLKAGRGGKNHPTQGIITEIYFHDGGDVVRDIFITNFIDPIAIEIPKKEFRLAGDANKE